MARWRHQACPNSSLSHPAPQPRRLPWPGLPTPHGRSALPPAALRPACLASVSAKRAAPWCSTRCLAHGPPVHGLWLEAAPPAPTGAELLDQASHQRHPRLRHLSCTRAAPAAHHFPGRLPAAGGSSAQTQPAQAAGVMPDRNGWMRWLHLATRLRQPCWLAEQLAERAVPSHALSGPAGGVGLQLHDQQGSRHTGCGAV
ncbi:hypothetical protein V8C86DRAFT_2524733 [Haematococcus lacustris]